MRRLESRLRWRVPAVLVPALVILFASVLADGLFPNRAFAGDGALAEKKAHVSRVIPLAAGIHLVFGAPPANEEHAEATFVYLHGVCGLTTNGCSHFEGAPGWLVCPQANQACSNGGSSWGGTVSDKAAMVDAALDAARATWPESGRAPVVLVGFSQGAYVAMDLARAHPGRFAGILLLGADTGRAIDGFRMARVPRVALACGAFDMMFPKMRATPAALSSSGIASRFASLGNVGHTYVASDGTDDVLTSMLEWVAPKAIVGSVESESERPVVVRTLD